MTARTESPDEESQNGRQDLFFEENTPVMRKTEDTKGTWKLPPGRLGVLGCRDETSRARRFRPHAMVARSPGWTSKVKVSAGRFLLRLLPFGLRPTRRVLCTHMPGVSRRVHVFHS